MSTLQAVVDRPAASHFSEHEFEQLALAIDGVPSEQRELFLTKLVILLAVGMPSGKLDECIARARMHLDHNNEETP